MSPVALGQTEGSGHRIGERGRNHHAQDEPQAGVVVGERGEGQYRHSGDRLRADSTALSASRKIRTTRAASRLFYTLETHSSSSGITIHKRVMSDNPRDAVENMQWTTTAFATRWPKGPAAQTFPSLSRTEEFGTNVTPCQTGFDALVVLPLPAIVRSAILQRLQFRQVVKAR